MHVQPTIKLSVTAALFCVALFASCSKSDPSPTPPADACNGKTIVITATPAAASACGNTGTITASATGSTGFTYKLNSGGTYQASGSFAALAAGAYTVFAKDGDGCEKSAPVTVAGAGSAGPSFTAVKSLIAARCQSCHNTANANGGMNFSLECNIIANKARIKVRAVDEGTMPQTGPLPQNEKDIISTWITAGGGYEN